MLHWPCNVIYSLLFYNNTIKSIKSISVFWYNYNVPRVIGIFFQLSPVLLMLLWLLLLSAVVVSCCMLSKLLVLYTLYSSVGASSVVSFSLSLPSLSLPMFLILRLSVLLLSPHFCVFWFSRFSFYVLRQSKFSY